MVYCLVTISWVSDNKPYPGDVSNRRLYYPPTNLSWVLGGWQSCGSRRPLQGTLPDRSVPVDTSGPECPRAEQNRQQPIDLCEVAGNVRPALPAGGSLWLV